MREGLKQSPWEELREQVVLGGERFLEQVRGHVKGDEQEQRNAQRLTVVRPELRSIDLCFRRGAAARRAHFTVRPRTLPDRWACE